mmetsp:Transcript_26477/g.103123  ORF Transcript_26477/g.103123 Transcript_26477/m.103123 type:complete len:189 (-) Transcript_26477:2414-2980(-)
MDSMYSAHRVNYQLRAHRRDSLIEFIKALLLPTMVMYAKGERKIRFEQYLGVFRSIEQLVDEHRERYELFIGKAQQGVFSSKLRELVPEVGIFFTSLPLTKAFTIYDEQEAITARNFIPPSFNDIRHVLNIAQLFALRKTVKLITFDGANYRNLLLIAYQPCAEILYAIAQVTKRCIKMEEISIRTAP